MIKVLDWDKAAMIIKENGYDHVRWILAVFNKSNTDGKRRLI